MNRNISMRSSAVARHYSIRLWRLQKILDRQPQGVKLPIGTGTVQRILAGA
jgi:hypothetical protein